MTIETIHAIAIATRLLIGLKISHHFLTNEKQN